jgi:hypothetical protein
MEISSRASGGGDLARKLFKEIGLVGTQALSLMTTGVETPQTTSSGADGIVGTLIEPFSEVRELLGAWETPDLFLDSLDCFL